MKKEKRWIKIKDKKTKRLIRIVYNPYNKPVREILKLFIEPEELRNVYGVKFS